MPFGRNRREKVPSNGGDVDGAQIGGPALGPDGEHGPGGKKMKRMAKRGGFPGMGGMGFPGM